MAVLQQCTCHRKQSLRNKRCKHCGADLDKLKKAQKIKYWIDYKLPDGKVKREFVGYSKAEAQDEEERRANEARRGLVIDRNITFSQLTDWYLNLEKIKALAWYPQLTILLNRFNNDLGGVLVSQVIPIDIENLRVKRQQAGYALSTIDQEVGAAKAMVNVAFDNGKINGDAVHSFRLIKKLLKRNSNARDRILSKDEFDKLMEHSGSFLKAILATGYYTGMRKDEILSLTWDKVDMVKGEISLNAEDTKDKEPRNIPIRENLLSILDAIPRAIHDNHVFLYKGKPVNQIRGALKNACEKAGIIYGRFVKGGFVFHDLRHTFNTNMRKAGVPESVIMSITGHSTREMFDRYNTIDHEDKERAVGQLFRYLESDNNLDTLEM